MTIKDEAVLDRFRQADRCEWCGCGTGGNADPHHVMAKGMGGGNRLDHDLNIVSLCRRCHTAHHAGNGPTQEQLFEVIAKRELTAMVDLIKCELWRIQREGITRD